jgi:LacI family transcriptional regulator
MNLKQLSMHLGLSPTTVSRALNGYPEVNERTRLRVQQAADQLSYRPNSRATRLATGRTMSIGHILPLSSEHEMVNPVFSDFIAGAGEIYSAAGYDLSLSVVQDEAETEAYRSLAAKGIVDGVVLHGPRVKDPRIELLQELGIPFVVHGRSSEVRGTYNWIDVNNRRAFYRATELLLDLGHRRIALLNGLLDMDFAFRRRTGFLEALTDRGVTVPGSHVTSGEMTENYGYANACRLLNEPEPPTAFVVSSIISAIGVRRAIHEAGLVMGRDLSVIVHDDDLSYFRNDGDVPIFTATRSSVREAGRQCASILLDTVAGERAPVQRLLEAELTLGQSTGPAPAMRDFMSNG